MQSTKLYRHFAKDGTLLYVGVASDGYRRQAQHLGNSKWGSDIARIELEDYPTREDALLAERKAVAKEKPLYNSHLSSSASRFRSTHSRVVSVRLPDALLAEIDRVGFENTANRTQAVTMLLEEALLAREENEP